MGKTIYIRHLLAALLLMLAMTASAYDFVKDGIYYSITTGTNVQVMNNGSYNTYNGQVNIPATVTNNGTTYKVTSVGYRSFRDCTGLTGVTIPEGVVYIMAEAFNGCTSLTNVTIPSTTSAIYTQAFEGCTSMTSAQLPSTDINIDAADVDGDTRAGIADVTALIDYLLSGTW